MDTNATIQQLRQSLATLYAVRDTALQRLNQSLQPAVRQMERDHLETLEQAILDTEGRSARLGRRYSSPPKLPNSN
jgi:hypothetical protein